MRSIANLQQTNLVFFFFFFLAFFLHLNWFVWKKKKLPIYRDFDHFQEEIKKREFDYKLTQVMRWETFGYERETIKNIKVSYQVMEDESNLSVARQVLTTLHSFFSFFFFFFQSDNWSKEERVWRDETYFPRDGTEI